MAPSAHQAADECRHVTDVTAADAAHRSRARGRGSCSRRSRPDDCPTRRSRTWRRRRSRSRHARRARAPRHLRRRARLGAARPGRPGADGLGGADRGRRGVRPAQVGLLAMNSLRLEKGYRDYGLDIENTDDPARGRAWRSRSPGTSPAVRRHGTRWWPSATPGAASRMVQVLLDDPEPLLYGGEPLLPRRRAGRRDRTRRLRPHARRRRRARHDRLEEHVTDDFIDSGSWELDIVGERYPATVSLRAALRPRTGAHQGRP